ncbi:hypothetical protein EV284_3538 [Streptomyces sp. BK022]|uniref:hypothetical protein n=1 Tax=Streptomyces sp. BK022 TaxID=2512123 RepID=UPI00102A2C1F|nr:hypothetical protein [Streptomyces sp. BK022]RZU36051.1 hypothetical protein EV284_3538 [Streptomyces sp. BK022]
MTEIFEPKEHTLVWDKTRDDVFEVMEVGPSRVALRPPAGGIERWVEKTDIRPATPSEELRPKLAKRNHDSACNSGSWGL